MARDDNDDDDDRPRKKKRSRDDDDDRNDEDGAFSEKPRSKTKSRDEDEDVDDDEDEGPRKKKRSREDDDDEAEEEERSSKKKKKAGMPGLLIASSIISMVWGGFVLLSGCYGTATSAWLLIELNRGPRIGNVRIVGAGEMFGFGQGYLITQTAVWTLTVFLAVALVASGIMLIMRNGLGKYPAMAAPLGMVAVWVVGDVITLIIMRGFFIFAHLWFFFEIMFILFTLAVAGCNIFMLLNKNVDKALK